MSDRDNPAGGTAMVALSRMPAAKPPPRRPIGADPRFLAQLIALGHDLPAQRARRREAPAVAMQAYRAAAALCVTGEESSPLSA
jgi:hypothetical protein